MLHMRWFSVSRPELLASRLLLASLFLSGSSACLGSCSSRPAQGRRGVPGGRFSTSCAAPAAIAGCPCRLRMRLRCAFFNLTLSPGLSGHRHHYQVNGTNVKQR